MAQNAIFWPICTYSRSSKAIKGNVCGVLCKRGPKIAINRQNNLKSNNLTQITNQFKLFDRNKQVIYPHPLNVTKAKFAGF